MRKPLFLLFFFFLSTFLLAQTFTEVSEDAGMIHAFKVDLATFGGGAAVLDYDNDGWEDVYITGGNIPDALFKNNGNGTFTNVFNSIGLEATTEVHTQGVAAADVNRDGFKDLLVTNFYSIPDRILTPNQLFINNGDGTFTERTEEYGLHKFASNSTGASFGDINADGYPDLFISNYFFGSPNGISIFNEATITENYDSAHDFIYINAGGQKFIDASSIYGINHNGFGFGGYFTDWDNDSDVDLLIANDFGFKAQPNVALRNNFPENTMTYRGNSLRMNFGMNAMGIAGGDYNMDGWMDYFVSNIAESLFAVNEGGQSFDNAGRKTRVAFPLIIKETYQGVPISWGANFFDYDHDMDVDLFVCNGALNPLIRPNHNFFFTNSSAGYFLEKGEELRVDDPRIGRGSVTFDYDKDGDIDLLVINQLPRDPAPDLPPAKCLLYRNDAADGNWLQVELEGKQAEMNGIGSRIEVVADGNVLVREIDGGSSHLSQSSTIAHFGLGNLSMVESVTVKWLGGKVQELKNVPVNQRIKITETDDPLFSFEENDLKIYPGFFTDQITMEYELAEAQPFDITVYDAQGRLIETLTQQENPTTRGIWQWEIDRDLIRGVYIFQLRTKDAVIAKRAVKL